MWTNHPTMKRHGGSQDAGLDQPGMNVGAKLDELHGLVMEGRQQRAQLEEALRGEQQARLQLEQEVARLNLGGDRGRDRPYTLHKARKFGATAAEDWQNYRRTFARLAVLNSWDDLQAKTILSACMEGAAETLASDLDPTLPNENLRNYMDRFDIVFIPPAASALAKADFDRVVQLPHETEATYHTRLRNLYRRAYPRARDVEALIRKFTMGLRNQAIRDQVLRADPQNYADCLQAAQNERSVQTIRKVATTPFGMDMEIGTIATFSAIDPELPGIIAAVEERTRKCFNCTESGHLVAACPQPLRASRFKAFQNNRPANRGRPNRRPNPTEGKPKGDRRAQLMAAIEGFSEQELEEIAVLDEEAGALEGESGGTDEEISADPRDF